jgi:hypothetical protein
MQKVFKTRFDENRSHAELTDLANSFSSHPFLTTNDSNYTSLLGKNKNAFFNVYFYKNNFKTLFNSLYVFEHNTNFGFFDFPFLIALKSDSSRYL